MRRYFDWIEIYRSRIFIATKEFVLLYLFCIHAFLGIVILNVSSYVSLKCFLDFFFKLHPVNISLDGPRQWTYKKMLQFTSLYLSWNLGYEVITVQRTP